MRTPKFKGLTIGGQWVVGNVSHIKKAISTCKHVEGGTYISNEAGMPFAYQIRPETISISSGMFDTNSKEIYNGDKVTFEIKGLGKGPAECYYKNGCFYFLVEGQTDPFPLPNYASRNDIVIEVMGNIHDIQDLLNP